MQKQALIGWLLLAVALIGGFVFYTSRVNEVHTLGVEPIEERDLQIPLEETTEARQSFAADYLVYDELDDKHMRPVYEQYIGDIGANGIIETLNEVDPFCHDEGHDLGKVIFAALQNVEAALRTCDEACSFGCMHGVLMEMFTTGEDGDEDAHVTDVDLAQKIDGVCTSEQLGPDGNRGECVHGVGHGMAFLSDYIVADATLRCDLYDDPRDRYFCATGMFMEYIGEREADDVLTQSEFYPCDTAEYPAACFRYKMRPLLARHYAAGGSLSTIVDSCLAFDNALVEQGCFHGIGYAHYPALESGDVTIGDVCHFGSEADQYVCIDGIMERMGNYHPSEAFDLRAKETSWWRDVCFAAVKGGMHRYDKNFEYYLDLSTPE